MPNSFVAQLCSNNAGNYTLKPSVCAIVSDESLNSLFTSDYMYISLRQQLAVCFHVSSHAHFEEMSAFSQ